MLDSGCQMMDGGGTYGATKEGLGNKFIV